MERLLSTDQAAKILQRKPETVRRYLRRGLLNGEKSGREWRVGEADAQALLHRTLRRRAKRHISARGFLKQFPGNLSSEQFMKEKHEDIEREEEKFRRHWGEEG
ncbi:MAG: helix-turn-helix domain-containing protein [Armatimonadota bacterium]|nr:helix-turn-helix domain-containing protein [Armatimonadota bacterium]